MSEEKNKKLLIFLLIAVAIFLVIQQTCGVDEFANRVKDALQEVTGGTGTSGTTTYSNNPEVDYITFQFYDKNHNEIKIDRLFAIVSGTPGVKWARATVMVQNTGNFDLSCTPLTLEPSVWDTAVVKTPRALFVGNKTAWTSAEIDFDTIATGTVNFSANISCTYNNGVEVITLPVKSGSIPITILPDGTGAGYEVSVSLGGTPTEYCGDGTCQSAVENEFTCPDDCAGPTGFVKFRTDDLSYVSGTEVAYFASTCGSALTGYGYVSASTTSTLNCDRLATQSETNCGGGTVSYLFEVNGTFIGNFQKARLYKGTTDLSRLCICATENDGVGYKYAYFDNDTATTIDKSPATFDMDKEIPCP